MVFANATSMLFGLALLAANAAGELANTTAIINVMSFNLRTTLANDPCPSGCWQERQIRIRAMLSQYQPDLIGTQEDAPDQTAFFNETLGYDSVGECAGVCQWNERNSIFFRSERWEILQGTTFALSDTPEVLGSNTWDLQYLRAAVLARFRHRQTGNTVCMLNTHFDISRGQPQSAALVADRISRVCKFSDTVLMTGDLNAPPQSQAVQFLLNKMDVNGRYSPIPLYETLTAAGAGGPTWIGGSFGDNPTGDKIDYIFARNDSQTHLRNATIITDLYSGSVPAERFSCSDHSVVQSTFCIGIDCQH